MQFQATVIRAKRIRLAKFDPEHDGGLEKDATRKQTEKYTERIAELQELLYANSQHAVLLVFQGTDAAGKDGAIRHLLESVNPAGVDVTNFRAPSAEERAHDFLWRVHRAVPAYGRIGVFNRSHYEAVLAERVLGIVPRKVWSQRYAQIVDWERMLAANRVVVLKFFLHISRREQAERIRERIEDPTKHWKFSPDDLKARRRWHDYVRAYEDMLAQTSHPAARWHLVPADRHWYRDYVVAKAVAGAMEALRMQWPKPAADLSKIKFK